MDARQTRSKSPSKSPARAPAKKARAKTARKKPAAKKTAATKTPAKKTPATKTPAKQAPAKSKSERAKPIAQEPLTFDEIRRLNTRRGLIELLRHKKGADEREIRRALRYLDYEDELERLQIELVKLQRTVQLSGRRIAILFEGRDAAGKGGAIRRFIEHLNPRTARVVALAKPSDTEKGQWYFQRYVKALPNPGEICFFDRSWYNRAVVEPVMGFCSKKDYARFMRQVPEFEHMLYEDGVELIKFWFSISKDEQEERFDARRTNPLKQWKISPVDEEAQAHWNRYTRYKEQMFAATHTTFSPWTIVKANSKKRARLESIRHVLNTLPYDGKDDPTTSLLPDPDIVRRYHRSVRQIDT